MKQKIISFCVSQESRALNYIENLIILDSGVTGCISISGFVSLVGISIVIGNAAVRLKICAITAKIKEYESIIKKKKKQYDKIFLLAKNKLNNIKILIKDLIDSHISHDELVSVKNKLKEFNEMKEAIKNLKTLSVYQRF